MKCSREEIEERIKECEAQGKFHELVQPINYKVVKEVPPDYVYLRRGLLHSIYSNAARAVAVPASFAINHILMGMRIRGRKNLRGVHSAVVCCNHVNELDNMMVREAVLGHRLYITVAEFNNRRDLIGSLMRAVGTLPFSRHPTAMRNIDRAISKLLSEDNYVLFYPEYALWWRYEKPRPFEDGAFYFAAKCNVPVIPMFITFSEPRGIDAVYRRKKVTTMNILPPIYPKPELTRRQNTVYMRDAAFEAYKKRYEEFYNKPLSYNTDDSMLHGSQNSENVTGA